MALSSLLAFTCCLVTLTLCTGYDLDPGVDLPTRRPLNIAHRGSSGMFPDHTAEGYRKAIEQGADVIECDVTITRDLHLICLHESWMNATTNVAQVFPDRWTTRIIDGQIRQDFFSVDFTLQEIKQLRVRQRFPFRDHQFDLRFPITTLQEYIQIAKSASRPVGLYIETKDPEWVNSLDIMQNNSQTLEQLLVSVLNQRGYSKKQDPCFLQSLSEESLKYLHQLTDLPLIMLVRQEITNQMLQDWSQYFAGIGPKKTLIIDVDPLTNLIRSRTDLVDRAHAYGLRVHPFTCRSDNNFLPHDYGMDPHAEYEDLINMGVDGVFTDFPGSFTRFLDRKFVPETKQATATSNESFFRQTESGIIMLVSILVTAVIWFKGLFIKKDLNDLVLLVSILIICIWVQGQFK